MDYFPEVRNPDMEIKTWYEVWTGRIGRKQCNRPLLRFNDYNKCFSSLKLLLREKIVASSATKFIVIVDSHKVVEKLGKFRVPIEVIQFASPLIQRKLANLGGDGQLRLLSNGQPFITDEGNYILDCNFGLIDKPAELAGQLEQIPGIVEHGLFINYATMVIVGRGDSADILKAVG